MTLSTVARLLLALGRLVGLAGAAFATATLVVGVFLFFYHGPEWNLGFVPLVVALRIVVAACVVWSVFKLDTPTLFRILLLFGGGSFVGLYGWYFLLFWPGGGLVAVGDFLYLVAGSMVGCAMLLARASARLGHDSA